MADFGLPQRLADLWRDGISTDLEIVVEGQIFRVHKVVLIALSKYFEAMFSENFAENVENTVELKAQEAEDVAKLVELIYTGDVNVIRGQSALRVLHCAIYLQMDSVAKVCATEVLEELNLENCFDIYLALEQYSYHIEKDEAGAFIQNNFNFIINNVCLENLKVSMVEVIAKFWQKSEWDLFLLVSEWFNLTNAGIELNTLMAKIRFGLLNKDQIKSIFEMDIYRESTGCWKELVQNAADYHQLPAHLKLLETSEQTTVRGDPSLMYILTEEKNPTGTIWRINAESEWETHPKKTLNTAHIGFSNQNMTLDFNNFLIMCKKRQWQIFDPRTLMWSTLTEPTKPLSQYRSVTYHKNHIYVVGYSNESQNYKIGWYSLMANTWQYFDLPFEATYPVASVYQERLYVACGVNEVKTGNMYSAELSHGTPGMWKRHASGTVDFMWDTARKMCVTKVAGHEVLLVVNNIMEMSYYVPSEDCWYESVYGGCAGSISGPILTYGNIAFTLNASHSEFDVVSVDNDDCLPRYTVCYDIAVDKKAVKISQVGLHFPIQDLEDGEFEHNMAAGMLAFPYVS